jgi:hypothetical protein
MSDNINEHDMTKKMLDVMRGGTQTTPIKPILEGEHDVTKQMLETLRSGKRLITELEEVSGEMNPAMGDAPMTDNSTSEVASESEDLSPDELKKQQSSFMENVSPKVEFRDFKIYRKERNVVFSGVFQDLGGLEWVMSLKDSDGLNITVQSLKIDNDTIKVMNALYGFYKNWSKEWAVKLNTEYKFKG